MMSNDASPSDRFWPLVEAACLGSISEEECDELQTILRGNSATQQLYLEYCRMHSELRFLCGVQNANDAALSKLALPAFPPVVGFLGNAMHGVAGCFSSGWPVAYLVATVILGVGFLIGAVVRVSEPTQVVRQPAPLPSASLFVGRITGMVDCQWERRRKDEGGRMKDELPTAGNGIHPSSFIPHPSSSQSLVALGDRFALTSGLMEITYDTGARVILQGPVTYEVESKAGGYLSVGKLTARVEKRGERREERGEGAVRSTEYGVRSTEESGAIARHPSEIRNPKSEISPLSPLPSPLFAVRTPTAVVTDLGTEFGVEVDKFGTTTSHVFRGSVRLQAASASGYTEGAGQVLRESESARVEPRSVERITMLDPSAKPNTFVRELPKQTIKLFDLVDVVAGGDGFSGKRNRGIDPTNGRRSDDPPPSKDFCLVDDGKYHRVDGMPFVDGVFVPDSRRAPVQLDSAGHTFDGVAKSSDPVTSGFIWAGGAIPIPPIVTYLRTLPIVLDGVDYTTPNHGVLCLHANKGITFDLEAIRVANPAWNIMRFRAAAANLDALPEKPGLADIRVFVDGRVCFQRRAVNRSNSTFSIVVPIAGNARFLTLMGTDGEDKINWDWIVFGDPHLVLSPIPLHGEGRLPQP